MKKILLLTVFAVFVVGILFPVTRTREGKSPFIQAVKGFFHYFPEEIERPGVKETPARFEKEIKKQIRYPGREEK